MLSSRHTNTTSQSARSDVPQCADEAIRGSLCVQGADVPNVQEAGHLIRHGGRSREEHLQQDRMRFITVQWSVEMFPNYGKCHCFSTEMCRPSLTGSTVYSSTLFFFLSVALIPQWSRLVASHASRCQLLTPLKTFERCTYMAQV